MTNVIKKDGLVVEQMTAGKGDAEVKIGDNIAIHYTGTLEDGSKFDSSVDRNEAFETQIGVGMLIKGWDEGIIGMKVGERRKLTIGSDYGYGEGGIPGVIPGGATLLFDVELLEIK